MVNNKYAIAYSEVLEILKHIPIEDYNKIPKNEIELFEAYADNNYSFNYDPSKTLKEQNVSNITKGIIILLFRDYWANEIQKNKIIAKQNNDRKILEEILDEEREKNSIENFFKNMNEYNDEQDIEDTKEVIEYNKSIFKTTIWLQQIYNFTNFFQINE